MPLISYYYSAAKQCQQCHHQRRASGVIRSANTRGCNETKIRLMCREQDAKVDLTVFPFAFRTIKCDQEKVMHTPGYCVLRSLICLTHTYSTHTYIHPHEFIMHTPNLMQNGLKQYIYAGVRIHTPTHIYTHTDIHTFTDVWECFQKQCLHFLHSGYRNTYTRTDTM